MGSKFSHFILSEYIIVETPDVLAEVNLRLVEKRTEGEDRTPHI